jgi:hypothetical protein
MLFRSILLSLAFGPMAMGTAWSGSPSIALDGQNPMMEESLPAVAVVEAAGTESDAPLATEAPGRREAPYASEAPAALVSAPERKPAPANRINRVGAAMGEHAPLALFSLGSLAVGGVFYAIHLSSRKPNVDYTAGDRSQLTSAVGAAGISSLLAAASYFYFARNPPEGGRNWDAGVGAGVDPEGDLNVGALITLPLPSLSR